MKRALSLVLAVILTASLFCGCEKKIFTPGEIAGPYEAEEIIEPKTGGRFALREKKYSFDGKPVSVFAVENLGDEPYDVYFTVRFINSENKTVYGNTEIIEGLSSGAKDYRVFYPEKEYETVDIKLVSYPAEKEGYYDKVEFGADWTLFAHAMFHNIDIVYSDPVFSYDIEYDARSAADEKLYYQGDAVIFDKYGEIFDIISIGGILSPGNSRIIRTHSKPDVLWDDGFVMPEGVREGVTAIVCLFYVDPEPWFVMPEITYNTGD